MPTFDSIHRDIIQNEERQDEYARHQRKLDEYEERLSQINQQVRQTTDYLGNNSQHRQNREFAEEILSRTMQSNNRFSNILGEAKQTVRNERHRLEDAREDLYRKRSQLI